jgi:hypothetical protein
LFCAIGQNKHCTAKVGIYTNPTQELWRYEKTAYAIAGIKGVIIFWLLLAVSCLVYEMVAHEKSKKA